uniref:PH domain-containing protein n=1 Tax=Branchiostoma floridae TaxID=7739 RepID=C3XQ29_BRAFL|eukprot:XP_002614041.1 hypothetical protein BRAFLDRAFT_113731 [Branchiostoma floridae]
MHELFAQVLSKRDLSRAGDLFSIEDSAIVNDLSEVLKRIQEISSRPDYLTNDNDQSVVEICITRVTTAIRETSTIERHGPALVSLWESCLKHNLKPLSRDEDPPHAKIASDIMSCIFQNYSKPSIMKLAVPVAVKFLQQGNRELSRNMSSYLSLAAIENAGLLARHTKHIIDSIIAGNRSLIRVLPQIYREAPDPINKRVPDLVRQLKECDGSERGNLLQLLSLVAKKEPKLMMPYVNTLVDFLPSPPTTTQVLPVLVDMATANATPFVGMLGSLQKTAEQQPMCLSGVARIVGAIGRTDEAEAKDCLIYLVQQLSNADHSSLPVLLGEIKTLVDRNPNQLTDHIKEINRYNDSSSSAARLIVQQLQQQAARSKAVKRFSSPTPTNGTIHTAAVPSLSTQGLSTSTGSIKTTATRTSTTSTQTTTSNPNLVPSPPKTLPTNDEVDVLQDWSKGKMEDIKDYMSEVNCRVPIPCSCAIEDTKSGSLARLGFMCAKKGEHCLYSRTQFITMSRHPKLWLHLMFLHIQAKERSALSKQDQRIQSLITQWERIKRRGVLTLEGHVMQSQFPSERDQEMLHGQLDEVRFFDLFSYDQSEDNWECFMCSNPDKATGLLQEGQPLIEGQLKEKKVRWKFIRRWRTRYFTLAGAQLVQKSRSKKDDALPIELSKVQSVKVVRKRDRNIPRAFEIFTDNKTYVFKAKDSKNAEQWLQCINIAVAQAKESTA